MYRIDLTPADVSTGMASATIRRMLIERRRQLVGDIERRVRDVREEGGAVTHHGGLASDAMDAEPDDDLAFALIHMKGQMLNLVNQAVRHCDEGTYGFCIDCGEPIAASRLQAVPFAVRCTSCQSAYELGQQCRTLTTRRLATGFDERVTHRFRSPANDTIV